MSRIRALRSPSTSAVEVIAPALIIGLRGRPGLGLQADRVERVARRLDAHVRVDDLESAIGERQRVGERLAHRLDRERDVVITEA